MFLTYNNGIEIEGLDFCLDARRKADFSFVSHAHTDHIASHRKIIATPETILFFKNHYKRPTCRALSFGQRVQMGEFQVELHSSGHILGGAQIRLESGGQRIVYTGDFKLQKGSTTPAAEILRTEILIMESTYGLEKYVFPEREKIIDQLINFVQKTLLSNQVPVILAYSLGKAQEAIKALGDFGFQIYAEETVYRFCELYERCGIKFTNLNSLPLEDPRGKVIVFPPYFAKYKSLIKKLSAPRTCFLSGWALDNSAKYRVGADLVLPLSDHADYLELLQYVEESRAKKIFTLHGFPEFAEDLRRRGYDAEYLGDGKAVSLTERKAMAPAVRGNLDLFQS